MRNLAVIDLVKLKNNALAVKRKLKTGVRFCAVVKADGYGHGAAEVANAIYKIADCYAVALVEEGIALRQAGIDKDILVLIPAFKSDLQRAVEYSLTLTATRKLDLTRVKRECERQGKKIKIHIKYNTGMNRQGVDSLDELAVMLKYAAKNGLEVEGLYSHFAFPENENSQKTAYNKFLLALSVAKGYNSKIIGHISASGGLLKGVQLDMVRVGLLLYGYKPFPSDIKVKPIMRLYLPVLSVRQLNAGDTALYGDKRTARKQAISLVRYGYADGLPRKRVRGQFNDRCMDVTAVKGRARAIVISDADALAKLYGTISYEILTKVCLRAEKIYKR